MSEAKQGSLDALRRVGLTRERVLGAAIELADHDGLEALSMRKLAKSLGVEAMSLYNHIPNKERLIDGMVELVFAEIPSPPLDVPWRDALRQRAVATRATLTRHRWAVELMESRISPGAESLRVHNAVLGCLREGGFSIEMSIQAMSVQDAYIYGFALQEKHIPFEDAAGAAELAQSQASEFSGDLAKVYPYLAEVVAGHVAEVGYDFTTSFEYGLDLVLDALEGRRDEPEGRA